MTMDIHQILKQLPHRYPILLVDRVLEIEKGKRIKALKNVSINEPFFNGHFPHRPVMPGVLQIEALAQTGGILALNNISDPENYDTYFLKIDKVRFKQVVRPGDTLILKLELLNPIRRGICEMKATAYVGNKLATEAELVAQIIRKDKKCRRASCIRIKYHISTIIAVIRKSFRISQEGIRGTRYIKWSDTNHINI